MTTEQAIGRRRKRRRFAHDRDLVGDSIQVFKHHPRFLVPLLAVWAVYAPTVLYLKYGVNWDAIPTDRALLLNLGAVFLFAFMLAVSCSVLLELIQQLEAGQKPSLSTAVGATLRSNLVKMLPIILVWTVVWFILLVIQAMLSKKKRGQARESFTAENAAKTLAGYGKFSLSAAFFRALNKGIRMVVFLILPAIAWENLGFLRAIKKGIAVFRTHLAHFATGFVLTELIAFVLFLPPAILFYISAKFEVQFSSMVWTAVIIYIGVAWSYSIYLEQMFTAELYLWNLKWEREVKARQLRGESRLPELEDIPLPHLLDEVHELLAFEQGTRLRT
jgi:hypothetical protein